MKTVKMKTRKLFMRTLLDVAARNGSDLVEPHAPELHDLRQRVDYDRVIAVLEGLGLIAEVKGPQFGSVRYRILPDGMCFFEKLQDDTRRFLCRSVVVPIGLSFVTSVITTLIVQPLAGKVLHWLSGLLQLIQPQ